MLLKKILPSLTRTLRPHTRTWVRHLNYEGEFTATSVTVHSQDDDDNLYVDAYSPIGFRLRSGIRLVGPCALFPRSVLHWNVGGVKDINEDSLSLFCMIAPKIDILVLGIGERENKINPNIIMYLRSKKISVEVLPTDQACATFNFLNSEDRFVAAGLIPPSFIPMEYDEDILAQTHLDREGDVFELERGFDAIPKGAPEELKENVKIIRERLYKPLGFYNVNKEEKDKKEESSGKAKDPDKEK